MSLSECLIAGGEELFIIGKNFLRGTHILFQQVSEDDTSLVVWQKEGDIDKDYFQTVSCLITFKDNQDIFYLLVALLGEFTDCVGLFA
jgi:nuclear factor of activated T-cells 5